jgi:hypothetical protein
MRRKPVFCLPLEWLIHAGLKGGVCDRNANAYGDRQSRQAIALVFVLLPKPRPSLPVNAEFAYIVQSAGNLNQLVDSSF